PQERLRLQARMRSDLPLLARRALAEDHVAEGVPVRQAPEAAGLELPQAIAYPYSGRERLPEEAPGLVAAAGHGADAGELRLGVLGAIAAAERADEPDDLAAELQPAVYQRGEEELGNERVSGNEDVAARP